MYYRNMDWSAVDGHKKIVRNRTYSADVVEEDIEMPTNLPRDVERKSIKERIQVESLLRGLRDVCVHLCKFVQVDMMRRRGG